MNKKHIQNKTRMKLNILLFCLLLFSMTAFTQTYLGLNIGKDISDFERIPIPDDVPVIDLWLELEEGSGKLKNPISIGIDIEQYLSNRIAFNLKSELYATHISGYNFDGNLHFPRGFEKSVNHYVRNVISIRFYPLKKFSQWSIGVGGNDAIRLGGHFRTENGNKVVLSNSIYWVNSRIRGWHLITSYTYKKLLFYVSYGVTNHILTNLEDHDYAFSRAKNFNFSISYRFQIIKKPLRLSKKSKGVGM